MLNETWRLLQALERATIPLESPHPLIKPLSKEKNVLRIRMNETGRVVAIEDVTEEERSGVQRIVRTSDGSFPVVKINKPLMDLSDMHDLWDRLSKAKQDRARIDLINEAVAKGRTKTWVETGWKWTDSLTKAEILIDRLQGDKDAAGILEIAVRFKKSLADENRFVSDVTAKAAEQLRVGNLSSVKIVQELLVGKGRDGKGKEKKISVLLILELDNDVSIHEGLGWGSVDKSLPTDLSATKRDYSHYALVSAFGGNGALLEEPFSSVKLPVLGSVFPLISMASNADKAKCNIRYGLTEYTVCPVTSSQSRRMAGALKWLVSQKKGTTWQSMPSGRFEMDGRTRKKKEKLDLLLVYVEEKPDLPVKTASYFGVGAEITQSQFEVDSKTICDALRGIVQIKPKSKMNLFLIRKISDGQVQVALAEQPLVKEIIDSAERWQTGARNIPPVTMYLPQAPWGKEKLPAVPDASPLAPYPDQVLRLLSKQWMRDGATPIGSDGKPQKAAQEVAGPGLADILAVMLRIEGKWKQTTQRMLDLIIRRIGPLLIGIFAAQHAYGPRRVVGQHEPLYDYPRESREVTLRAIATLGILLDALGLKKEAYMNDVPFQIGQIMALADTLHKDYCIVVRRGQMPNTLIGTSLMRRALDNPVGALADLSERMMEYLRWAKIAQASSEWPNDDQRRIAINEARKRLRQYQPIADMLGTTDLPSDSDDIMKAQLLLGYLASPPIDDLNDNKEEEK
ncbi:hypothetical protein [Syntrophorhabdus aromaticivorans]|uniref:hypothetical protein n=1 Tax=Syntrophorhabdus aromaticivorans TaxID=328301 RepID=UPI000413F79C|nr:hypothetical protein [Syntrophorhabdus aromaticivorans]